MEMLLDWQSNGIRMVEDLNKENNKEENDETLDFETEDWEWLDDEEEYIGN